MIYFKEIETNKIYTFETIESVPGYFADANKYKWIKDEEEIKKIEKEKELQDNILKTQEAKRNKLAELEKKYINSQTFIIKATDKEDKLVNFQILARQNYNGGILTSLDFKLRNAERFNTNVFLYLPNTTGVYEGYFTIEETKLLYKEIVLQSDKNEKIEIDNKVKILNLKTLKQIEDFNLDVFEENFTINLDDLLQKVGVFQKKI